MKKLICNFMGEDIILDTVEDKAVIELIEWQRKKIEDMRGDSVDAAMYRFTSMDANNPPKSIPLLQSLLRKIY